MTNPVTVHVLRKAKPGQAEALEQQERAILASASSADGYLGSGVLRGTIGDTDYVNAVLHFATRAQLAAWRETSDAHKLIDGALEHVADQPEVELAEGVTAWLDRPQVPLKVTPPKWKMCLVTWLAIFPLLTLVLSITIPLLGHMPMILRLFLTTVVIAPLMTWVVMPLITRIFAGWLFRSNPAQRI